MKFTEFCDSLLSNIEQIENAYANPIKFDYDYCLKQYSEILVQSYHSENLLDNPSMKHGPFFDESKVMQMPGINFEKIYVYKNKKKHSKKLTIATSIHHSGHNSPTSSDDQKRRYKSI